MIMLQAVKHTTSYIGVCSTTTPKRGRLPHMPPPPTSGPGRAASRHLQPLFLVAVDGIVHLQNDVQIVLRQPIGFIQHEKPAAPRCRCTSTKLNLVNAAWPRSTRAACHPPHLWGLGCAGSSWAGDAGGCHWVQSHAAPLGSVAHHEVHLGHVQPTPGTCKSLQKKRGET